MSQLKQGQGQGQGQGIQLKQTQTLTVTPQMTQRLHILQCNQQQLSVEVQQMLDKNIMLSQVDDMDFDLDYDRIDGEHDQESVPDELSATMDADMDWTDIHDDYLESFNDRPKKIEDVEGFQDGWIADEESFDEQIEQAIYLSTLSDKDKQLANIILQNLDNNYFLDTTPEQLAKSLKVDLSHLSHVIGVIKHLSPAGIASRNIRDCMLAQLHSGIDNSNDAINAHEILSEYFDYIDKKPEFIRKRLGISEQQYCAAMQVIRSLSPYPNPASTTTAQLIKPDVFVRKRLGMFYASPNKDVRYDLSINETYANLTATCKGDEKRFMRAQLQEAKFLLDALDQRHKTVVRVANAIIMQQQDYFIDGDKAMQPLSMRDIAEQLDLSESTISRAVSGKYLSFNQKLIELRFFFAQGLSCTEENTGDIFGEEVATSSTAAKAHIKEIIEAEPAQKPLSDSKIEGILKERGIDISRRTVTKYREAMGIPKTSLRKQLL